MKWLLRALKRAWLKHEAKLIAEHIEYEERQHKRHAERLEHWFDELARVKTELRLLEQRAIARLASQLLAGRR